MSDLMNQLINSEQITWGVQIKVDIEHTEWVSGPTVQILSFTNDLLDKVEGIFTPDEWVSISHLTNLTKANLTISSFWDEIQEATLNWIKWLLSLEQSETPLLKTGDTIKVHLMAQNTWNQSDSININQRVWWLLNWKTFVEGIFMFSWGQPVDPFFKMGSTIIKITGKEWDLYTATIQWKDTHKQPKEFKGSLDASRDVLQWKASKFIEDSE